MNARKPGAFAAGTGPAGAFAALASFGTICSSPSAAPVFRSAEPSPAMDNYRANSFICTREANPPSFPGAPQDAVTRGFFASMSEHAILADAARLEVNGDMLAAYDHVV